MEDKSLVCLSRFRVSWQNNCLAVPKHQARESQLANSPSLL